MDTTGATPTKSGAKPFDVVATYKRLLIEDPELTMPVAAIESLVLALAHTPASTISETLDLLSTLTATLKRHIPNPISLSAGTDLFQRYIITTLQRPSGVTSPNGRSNSSAGFDDIRTHLVRNGQLFVERAKEARDKIAGFGKHFIRDGHTVLTNGGSRVVGALLRSAAEQSGGFGARGSIRFRVIYVVDKSAEADKEGACESMENVTALRKLGVPVATIPPTAIAYCLGQVTACFVGAEGVVENGGIISRLGTYQMGMLAKSAGKPFYVVAESHKFVRLYPLGQSDLGIEQRIVEFKSGVEGKEASGSSGKKQELHKDEGVADMYGDDNDTGVLAPEMVNGKAWNQQQQLVSSLPEAVDFTVSSGPFQILNGWTILTTPQPPNLISGIITESGVLLPSAVSEELIKIWF